MCGPAMFVKPLFPTGRVLPTSSRRHEKFASRQSPRRQNTGTPRQGFKVSQLTICDLRSAAEKLRLHEMARRSGVALVVEVGRRSSRTLANLVPGI
jgi:hypothetical protein